MCDDENGVVNCMSVTVQSLYIYLCASFRMDGFSIGKSLAFVI